MMRRPGGETREIRDLLRRYNEGKCTGEEKAWVESWYIRSDHGLLPAMSRGEVDRELRHIQSKLPRKAAPPETSWRVAPWRKALWRAASNSWRVAAVFALLAAGVCGYLFMVPPLGEAGIEWSEGGDIAPGGNRATLVLDNGETLMLDTLSTSTIAGEPGTSIIKTNNSLVYAFRERDRRDAAPAWHTLHVPKGGQYRLVLSDGTAVWLNAASSLKYPASFGNAPRKVRLTGEAYFEVATTGQPFLVETRGQVVEVLGTHFNINAYENEPTVRTTLLEGSVRVTATAFGKGGPVAMTDGRAAGAEVVPETAPRRREQVLLNRPGQQSVGVGDTFRLRQIDPAIAVAWKDGLFRFHQTDVGELMRQLSRWYDVEVTFRGETPDIQLWGEVYRNSNASQVLEILRYFGLEYEILRNGEQQKIVIYRQNQNKTNER